MMNLHILTTVRFYMNELNPLDRIRELCEQRKWSYYQLSKASGIPYSTLNTMLNKENIPSHAAEAVPGIRHLHSGIF